MIVWAVGASVSAEGDYVTMEMAQMNNNGTDSNAITITHSVTQFTKFSSPFVLNTELKC